MQTIKINKLGEKEKEILEAIRQGKIFVYPTDTVYGLGCNALNKNSVEKIRKIKGTNHPFSVIAPSKEWIKKNVCIRFPQFMRLLPGPYTLIFRKKKPKWLPWISNDKIGIRIPKHPISKLVRKSGLPFVTTSANISGQNTISEISQLPDRILKEIDIVIDGGKISGKPSTIFDLSGQSPRKIR